MELSESTLSHLRDEAYAYLARQALLARVEQVGQERATVASTRPPFGVLARRETREAFARSMRVVDDNEAVLHDQLTEISGIVRWLRPIIREDVSTYLAGESPDYCRILQIMARLDDWERAYHVVPELIVAFARDLRAARLALAPTSKVHALVAHELATLRESAERLVAQQRELTIIEQAAVTLAPADLARQIVFPPLPDLLQRVAWVSRLAVIPPETALIEVKRVEKEARDFLAGSSTSVLSRLQASREACAQRADQTLEEYWNQLRAHARAHYVEERDVAEIIAMLSARYVDTEIQRHQQTLSVDPFATR